MTQAQPFSILLMMANLAVTGLMALRGSAPVKDGAPQRARITLFMYSPIDSHAIGTLEFLWNN